MSVSSAVIRISHPYLLHWSISQRTYFKQVQITCVHRALLKVERRHSSGFHVLLIYCCKNPLLDVGCGMKIFIARFDLHKTIKYAFEHNSLFRYEASTPHTSTDTFLCGLAPTWSWLWENIIYQVLLDGTSFDEYVNDKVSSCEMISKYKCELWQRLPLSELGKVSRPKSTRTMYQNACACHVLPKILVQAFLTSLSYVYVYRYPSPLSSRGCAQFVELTIL